MMLSVQSAQGFVSTHLVTLHFQRYPIFHIGQAMLDDIVFMHMLGKASYAGKDRKKPAAAPKSTGIKRLRLCICVLCRMVFRVSAAIEGFTASWETNSSHPGSVAEHQG